MRVCVLGTRVRYNAKTDKPIEMPFGVLTLVGSRKRALGITDLSSLEAANGFVPMVKLLSKGCGSPTYPMTNS